MAVIDIESIMRQIRIELLKKQKVDRLVPGLTNAVSNDSLDPELSDNLYQAGITVDVDEIELLVTPSRFPIIGHVMNFFRHRLHAWILKYVTDLASRQSSYNRQYLAAVLVIVNIFGDYQEEI